MVWGIWIIRIVAWLLVFPHCHFVKESVLIWTTDYMSLKAMDSSVGPDPKFVASTSLWTNPQSVVKTERSVCECIDIPGLALGQTVLHLCSILL